MPWLTRAFFVLLAAAAFAGVGCTRYGKPTPVPPTIPPLTILIVNPVSGSDTTGNGSSEKPYKTLTKALAVIKNSTTPGLTIQLAAGQYSATSGETFPIVVPTGVTINGSGYGTGFAKGSFINGIGEDAALEKLAGFTPGSVFATIEVAAGVTAVSFNGPTMRASRAFRQPSRSPPTIARSMCSVRSASGTQRSARTRSSSGILTAMASWFRVVRSRASAVRLREAKLHCFRIRCRTARRRRWSI